MTVIDLIENCVTEIQTSGVPYYDYDSWNTETEKLSFSNLSNLTQGNKFPLVFLLLENLSEDRNKNLLTSDANIDIFIVNETKVLLTTKERHIQTMPIIRNISENLILEMSKKARFENYKYKEFFYDKSKSNKLDSIVDVIQIGISKFRFDYKCNN